MQVLLAAICWLAFCEALEVERKVNSSIVKDNESAESAPLYSRARHIVGVYASGSPYGAYSYIAPTVIKAPLTAGSQVAPVSVSDSAPTRSTNGYLKNLRDSYGKYLATPQAVAYKAAFPQQFLPIQALPVHLSQPLAAAAAPNQQYKTFAPNYFFGTQYKVPSPYSYSATPTPLTQLASFSKPLVYAGNVKNFLPVTSFFSRGNRYHGFAPVQQQQATGSKTFYANTPDVEQKKQQKSESSVLGSSKKLDDKGQIQAAPAQTSVTAIVNGKQTVVTLETNPPIPQLDISLLEPLTFDNPVVPQVQHFLPKINSATYAKLPTYNIQHSSKKHKDVPVHRINVYNSGHVETPPKKKSHKKKSRKEIDSVKPQVIIKGNPEEQEFSYQINMPNHKETYNEQVVSYDKQTNTKPVTYSYNKESQSEPENYSYSHSSKDPLKVTHVEYVDNESPKQLVYTFSPEENEEDNSAEIYLQPPVSEESSTASNDDDDSSMQREHTRYDDKRSEHVEDNDQYAQRHKDYKDDYDSPKQFIENESSVGTTEDSTYQDLPQHHSTPQSPSHGYYSGHQPLHSTSPRRHKNHHVHHSHLPAHYHHHHHHHSTERTVKSTENTELPPRQSHSTKAEHRGHEYKKRPKQELQREVTHNIADQHYRSQPLSVAVQDMFEPITPEYEEDIKILPTHAPHAPHRTQNQPLPPLYLKPFSSSAPHVLEQSKRVIIKENEESPDARNTRMQQVMDEMVAEVENEEEDFEKGYKASAFGFPAYGAITEETDDGESDLNNPDSYGAPRYQTGEYDAENPFEKFQTEDEPYKSFRSSYKDGRDDKKDNYYLDYSANKPDVYADFYKKKADYYKLFKKHNPEKSFSKKRGSNDREFNGDEEEAKVVASSSFLYPVSPTQKQNIYNSQYKAPNIAFKYDYPKVTPRDSRAHASQPYIKYRTNFVEPQFQYGFEPITAPLLLDSELAAMASNDSPESERPGMRKKVYEENWYIKKTRTAAGKPS